MFNGKKISVGDRSFTDQRNCPNCKKSLFIITKIKIVDTEKAENENNSSTEDNNEPEENCPFRKKFYTMNETTEAISKSTIKEIYHTS